MKGVTVKAFATLMAESDAKGFKLIAASMKLGSRGGLGWVGMLELMLPGGKIG